MPDANPEATQQGSLTFAASQRFVRPMQREITALINAYHQACAETDEESALHLRATILERLDDFDASAGDAHEYPNWIRPVMRANAHSAFAELDEAIRHELAGLPNAQLDMHKAISHNNLSDHYRRLGDYEHAIDHAQRAFDLWPDNDGVIVNLAQALFRAGRKQDAGQIIAKLAELSALDDPKSVLAAHLRFEDEMAEMAELPQVKALYERIRSIQNPSDNQR